MVFGIPNGRFNPDSLENFAVGQRPVAVAIEDLNDDGNLDLVAANAEAHSVSVLLGQGNGIFGPSEPAEVPVGITPSDVAVGHLDGIIAGSCAPGLYVVTANANSNNVAILQVRSEAGDISLAAPQFVAVGKHPISVQIADFNGDGRPDIITANQDSDNVSALLQRASGDGECIFIP